MHEPDAPRRLQCGRLRHGTRSCPTSDGPQSCAEFPDRSPTIRPARLAPAVDRPPSGRALREAEARDAVTALATQAAAHASLDDPGAVAELLRELHAAGAEDAVTTLLARDPARLARSSPRRGTDICADQVKQPQLMTT